MSEVRMRREIRPMRYNMASGIQRNKEMHEPGYKEHATLSCVVNLTQCASEPKASVSRS